MIEDLNKHPYVHMLLSETTRCLGERMTSTSIHPCWSLILYLRQSTPDNSNLQGKSKKVRVIGSLKEIAGSAGKTSFLLHSEHFNHI